MDLAGFAFDFPWFKPAEKQRQTDVLLHRQVRQDVEGLEHEAELVPAQQGARVVVQRARSLCLLEPDLSGIGRLEPGDDVEQRGLADPRFAEHGDVLPLTHIKGNGIEHRTLAETLAKAGDLQHVPAS